MKNHFQTDGRNALEAKVYAQWIAFAPIVFQASRILRDSGILAKIGEKVQDGLTYKEVCDAVQLSPYAVRVLLEAGLGIELLTIQDDRYRITNTGILIMKDELTRVNMNFSQDICYLGMSELEKSLHTGKPEGLPFLGNWSTIYEGLSILDPKYKQSWFEFDHYYSDSAFDECVRRVMADKPKKLMDIGGNTGKWTLACMQADPEIEVTIFDLPVQARVARKNIEAEGFAKRVHFIERNILTEAFDVHEKFDAIWMSQFLDCFSDDQIVDILRKCRGALSENGFVYILETFWDRQRFKASAFCLQMTSLYFTAMANGNSQMYDSKVFFGLIEKSGLEIAEITDNVGLSHTLVKCRAKKL